MFSVRPLNEITQIERFMALTNDLAEYDFAKVLT